ncbi:MAG: acetate/propionate family kinase [Acidimicrobiia bacterium]
MSRVLVVNAGSTTLKLVVLDGDRVEVRQDGPWDGTTTDRIDDLLRASSGVDAVGHRVVHGGERTRPAVVDDDLVAELEALGDLAPLHQPRSLAALRAARRALPGVDHVACFDTAFHTTLPPAAHTYALPAAWRARWNLRRFGFHGLSHAWVATRAPVVAGRGGDRLRLVSCHLGAGASACAITGGRSIDTTMGFTPLDGLVMATRSGSVDPGLLLWLLDGRLTRGEVAEGLDRGSGLAGLSGTDGDMRTVLDRRREADEAAALAFDVAVHRLRQAVAAMAAALGGIDVLAFTGGVGEHLPEVRAATAAGLGFLGVHLDTVANDAADDGRDADLSAPDAATRTVVIASREDLEIARQARSALAPTG